MKKFNIDVILQKYKYYSSLLSEEDDPVSSAVMKVNKIKTNVKKKEKHEKI